MVSYHLTTTEDGLVLLPGAPSPARKAGMNGSSKSLPTPKWISTPKKKDSNHLPNGHSSLFGSSPVNGEGSPKRRKVVHMASDEEDVGVGEHFGSVVNGQNHMTNGKVHKHKDTLSALQEHRRQLPIAQGKDALLKEIRENDTVVLLGETGSGKTTQIPQYILESDIAGTGVIAVTQPRRVAATSLAARVAQEQNSSLGKLVGYSVRFDEMCSRETRIKYVTDGMLARELHSDPLLSKYSVIVIDEAHERTLNTDLLITNLKTIQKTRNQGIDTTDVKGKGKAQTSTPLKIIIMSATLDAEKFSQFYDNAKVIYVKGRQHPVKILYTVSSQTDYIDAALRTFFQIHVDEPPGDVLIFLPGQEDIESLHKTLTIYANQLPVEKMQVLVCSLYASLPQTQQAKAFSRTPAGFRKCILATNIAETSITISGVKYVIDTGKCKEKTYIARSNGSGMETLLTQDISKSSAMQRAGRAGREGKGWCFRLYTEADYNKLPVSSTPEIQRCSLTSSMLQLKCLGQDLESLDFMDKPDGEAVMSALKILYFLGAIDEKRALTPIGREMNDYPLEPRFSRTLLAAKEFHCLYEMIDIVSVFSASSQLFFDSAESRDQAAEARNKFRHSAGDHLTVLNAFRAYEEVVQQGQESKAGLKDWCRKNFLNERTLREAMDIREQLRQITTRSIGADWKESCRNNDEPILKSLLKGMAHQTALLRPEGGYKQTTGPSIVRIHPGSVVHDRKAPAILYDELIFTGIPYVRGVTVIPPSLLSDIPLLFISKSQ